MFAKLVTLAFYGGFAIWIFYGSAFALKVTGVSAVIIAILTLL